METALQNPSLRFMVAIPARHGSSRLPGKPLLPLAGEPMIVHVVRRAREAGAREVVVATDDPRIANTLMDLEVDVEMTRLDHTSGSDRLAEVIELRGWPDDTIIVNLQGDEPLAPASGIRRVAYALATNKAPMATLATPIISAEELFDPNCVKVVRNQHGDALYFSRAPMPWPRDAFATDRNQLPDGVPFLRHIGIYAYRASFLRTLTKLPHSLLEKTEMLEQLRVLEHGHSIHVALAPEPFPGGVDTIQDLIRVDRAMAPKSGRKRK
ncbi:3-deoxy-manno-octulosonate cytidylyltransferase [Dokdonella sp.]|uniref:3-deoxy-manno-octulosonate cytidylyltransferase n=1 Tax=Dokdonella sp. TaxID=2291710 RepID=UPI0025BAD9EE|nr:3-deoxy-manno-octulosonate cytidylyltransferase [Dokdonella sp.]MBX3693051.1 3-deoxy-manno-octulosonate cytidylyltransferase [Dokdonella sp.]